MEVKKSIEEKKEDNIGKAGSDVGLREDKCSTVPVISLVLTLLSMFSCIS